MQLINSNACKRTCSGTIGSQMMRGLYRQSMGSPCNCPSLTVGLVIVMSFMASVPSMSLFELLYLVLRSVKDPVAGLNTFVVKESPDGSQ